MKKEILDRYDRTEEGRVIVDVSASKVEELYEDFDKQAPYHRKDLDEELASYLADCVREIGPVGFVIRFTLDSLPSGELQERFGTSLRKFFIYQRELEVASIRRMVKRSLAFFLSGIVLLFASYQVAGIMPGGEAHPFYRRVIVEGVTIAAWVALWESLTIFLVNWWPSRQRIRLNSRIAEAAVLFQSQGEKR
ncbi:MAG: hypothetical protein HGA97_10280 [Chlorobiaceae bacterium]|nr:hypothetical protein [Chlorobiaceae bacterium]